MIFTIISWMLLTEIDFEISFARQIAAFDNLNLFFKGILAKITSITVDIETAFLVKIVVLYHTSHP